jgi:hypothetical protein
VQKRDNLDAEMARLLPDVQNYNQRAAQERNVSRLYYHQSHPIDASARGFGAIVCLGRKYSGCERKEGSKKALERSSAQTQR